MQTRQIIIEQAIQLFNTKGVQRVTMREIANASHIAIGNLTYYFPRKKDLIQAIMDEYCNSIFEMDTVESIDDLASLLKLNIETITKLRFYFLDLDYIKQTVELQQRDTRASDRLHLFFIDSFYHLCDSGLFTVNDKAVSDALLDTIWISHLGYITYTNQDTINKTIHKFIARQLLSLKPLATSSGSQQIDYWIETNG